MHAAWAELLSGQSRLADVVAKLGVTVTHRDLDLLLQIRDVVLELGVLLALLVDRRFDQSLIKLFDCDKRVLFTRYFV